jgi:Protein of unknown function (DUF1659)
MRKEVCTMAVNKVLASTTFSIEVQSGTDTSGAAVYRKKTYTGIRTDAVPQNVFDVAEAVKAVLSIGTRDYYLNDASKLVNQ